MNAQDGASAKGYPQGRGYGHDYMRGGEVFNGYGHSARDEFERSRGELRDRPEETEAAKAKPVS